MQKDYARLVAAAAAVLAPAGVLFASTNAADLAPETFLDLVQQGIKSAGKKLVGGMQYVPQPADFPIARAEPAYLKTIWLRCA